MFTKEYFWDNFGWWHKSFNLATRIHRKFKVGNQLNLYSSVHVQKRYRKSLCTSNYYFIHKPRQEYCQNQTTFNDPSSSWLPNYSIINRAAKIKCHSCSVYNITENYVSTISRTVDIKLNNINNSVEVMRCYFSSSCIIL